MGVKLKERRPGEWWLYIDHNGKRKAKKVGDKQAAVQAAKKIQAQLVLGDFDMKTRKAVPSFGNYCELWLADYIKATKRTTTYQRYKGIYENHVKSALGKIAITELKRSDVRALFLKLNSKKLSRSTISSVKNVISGVLEYAIDEELIKTNVSKGVLRRLGLDNHEGREPARGMTPQEVELFLTTCLKNARAWHPFFLTAFRTGMRLGELLGLEWGDIDFNGRFIQVQRSFRHGQVTPTKTGKSRRVDMSDQLHQTLKDLLTRRKEESLRDGSNAPVEIVFHTNGGNTSQNTVRNVWKRLLRKAGLSDKRLHDIRHTYASTLLTTGASPVYVKEQLGHSSIQMTVDIYGHLIPSANRETVNRLDSTQQSATQAQPTKIKSL
jgi:integrase